MASAQPVFSLVLATIHRTEEVRAFLASLLLQAAPGRVEVIVVDQNSDSRLVPILADYQGRLSILHLRSEKGLSRARNAGLSYARGQIVAFPDDDCVYPPGVLAQVQIFFENFPQMDGVSGMVRDLEGIAPVASRWARKSGPISESNHWTRAVSISLFFRRHVIETVGPFDASLGVGSGSPFGSGEETDYVLRTLKAGFKLWFEPTITLLHPKPVLTFGELDQKRALSYGMGYGRVLKKHGTKPLRHWVRPLGGSVLFALRGNFPRARYHWKVFEGRVRGYFHEV